MLMIFSFVKPFLTLPEAEIPPGMPKLQKSIFFWDTLYFQAEVIYMDLCLFVFISLK